MTMNFKVSKTSDDDDDDEKNITTCAQIVVSNDDLLTEILTRLPIKSIIRFESVSKRWYTLISSPPFHRALNRHPNPAVGLLLLPKDKEMKSFYNHIPLSVDKSCGPPFRILNFTREASGLFILHSCNGLLLCSNCDARFYVYNPTTNKFSTLTTPEKLGHMIHMSLVFDPAKSCHYKVVCVRGTKKSDGYKLHVYSSETSGPWRRHGPHFEANVCFHNGVYCNGAIHWIKFSLYKGTGTGPGDSLYFNPDDHETPQVMPTPPHYDDSDIKSINSYFGESCDHLHFVDIIWPETQIIVYEMRRDYSEWFVKYVCPLIDAYHIKRDNLNSNHWWIYYRFVIYTIVRGDKEEDSFLILQFQGKVTRYNFVYRTCETIYEFHGNEPYYRRFHLNGFPYIESLCRV